MNKRILECSTKGDKRYSAFCAYVSAFGKRDSIENHYQLAKRFGDVVPKSWRDAKGKEVTHICLNGNDLPAEMLSQWYKLLWLKFLDQNPQLVAYASEFDDYNDIFKGRSVNCQADVIRQYIKEGRESIVADCSDLIATLNGGKR